MKLSQIKTNDRNPRFITTEKFEKLKNSLREFPEMMDARPITINEGNVIMGGNMRFQALKALGYTEVPDRWVQKIEGWTVEQWQEFAIKDNVQFGDWDFDILAADYNINQLMDWGFDYPDFVEPEQEPEVKDDDYNVPEKVKTDIQEGDVFDIGPHRLVCGDARNEEAVAKLLNGQKVDLVITDPPYNVDYVGKTKDKLKIENDRMGDGAFYEFLLEANLAMFRNLKPGGAFYIFHADSEGYNFRKAVRGAGMDIKQNLIWVKNAMVMGRQDYQWKHEPILYGWKEGAAHYFTPDRTLTTVIDEKINLARMSKKELEEFLGEIYTGWKTFQEQIKALSKKQMEAVLIGIGPYLMDVNGEIDIDRLKYLPKETLLKLAKELDSDKITTSTIYHDRPFKSLEHPTMKPVTLVGYLMKNSSRPKETVLDTFAGSGSAMVAAHQTGRRCMAMDLDPVYCAVIIDRMVKLDPGIEVKRNGEPYQQPELK